LSLADKYEFQKQSPDFTLCSFLNLQNQQKRQNPMNNLKFRIWDAIEKQWFTPSYRNETIGKTAHVREILLSQTGEVIMREYRDGIETLVHEKDMEFPGRYIKNMAVGIRDSNSKRYHFNDIVCFTDSKGRKSYGVLIWYGDRLAIGSGPIDDYTAIDPITEHELREAEIVGSVYTHRHVIMGTEPIQEVKKLEKCAKCIDTILCTKMGKCVRS
jgi:hypothetical protein